MNPRLLPLLLSLLLASTPGRAATGRLALASDAPHTPRTLSLLAGSEPAVTPGTQSETWHAPEVRTERPGTVARVLAEVGMGVGGVVGLGAAGAGLGALVPCHETGFLACFEGPTIGVTLGALVGLPLGVWLGGKLAGGQGSFVSALGGMGVGLAAAFVVSLIALPISTTAGQFAGVIGFALLPVAGAVIAYERSDTEALALPRRESARPGLRPLLAMTSGGGLIGLGGHF